MKKIATILFLSLSTSYYSCSDPKVGDEGQDTTGSTILKNEKTSVRTAPVARGTFYLEVISNGKAFAANNAEIRFPLQEQIQNIPVKNGDRVAKGQVLAVLNTDELKRKLVRSRDALDKAMVELDDRLIDYGYRLKDSSRIPKDIMRMAKIKSGYNNASYDYADTRLALNKAVVLAPFAGKVADIEARPFNNTDAFRKLCTVIDDGRMKVEFNVLETEFSFVAVGAPLEVTSYSQGRPSAGKITEINPRIDDNGMIKITGMVNNVSGGLLNGMNVRIVIKNAVNDQLFVPKEAIVKRQDRQVVFTYENGRAKWNYVETGVRNTKYVTISSGLKKGQSVIVSNNTNLAHDSEVSLDTTVDDAD